MTTTTQLFKEFTTQVLDEHKNNKKVYDECVDVYANTQLFDLNNIVSNSKRTFGKDFEYSPDMTQAFAKMEGYNFFIPFESCFVKIQERKWDNNIDYYTTFFHDYLPNVITGTFTYATKTPQEMAYVKIPFTIRNILNNIEISFDTSFIVNRFKGMIEEKEINERMQRFVTTSLNNLVDVIYVFDKLSQKTVLLDKPIIDKPTYYRYKNKSKGALKVNSKPIYIVLDAEKKDNIYNYNNIEKQGRLERNFAFPVIGHWRRLDAEHKRGKDRNGEYIIDGFTWVKSHIRGDKDSPIVQRERIVISKGEN